MIAKLLLAFVSTVILGSEPHRTHDHVLLSDGTRSPKIAATELGSISLPIHVYSE